jgi:hypothetical protein
VGEDPSKHKEDQSTQGHHSPTIQADPNTHPTIGKESLREADTVMEMDE